MKTKSLLIILVALAFTACKTQEDIRRERTMENINEKISQTQQSSASTNLRFQSIEEQMAKLNGNIEELAHNKGSDSKEVLLLKERISQLEETNKKQSENIKLIADKMNEQTKYIEQVIKSLGDLSEKKEEPKENIKKKTAKEESKSEGKVEGISVKAGIAHFKAGSLAEARSTFEELLDNGKLAKKDKAASLFYLGLVELKEKKYEEAKVYFSRLYTEVPESSFSAPALLNLAKSFAKLKSKEEAKQAIDELITNFPKSKEAVEGAKIKLKL
jgi:TolA-binding protein